VIRAAVFTLFLGMNGLGFSAHGAADNIVEELANAQLPDPPLEPPPSTAIATARTARLQKALRCPVCQGLSVADSPSTAARAMGDRIAELVQSGYTEAQITEYFVDRYGAWVELEPPTEDHGALFYSPVIALALGIIFIVGTHRRRQKGEAEAEADEAQPNEPANDDLHPWRARILAELERR